MTVTELLTRFANPDVIQTLTISEKLMAGLVTTILGMGITFIALILLQFIISWMDKILNNGKKAQTNTAAANVTATKQPKDTKENLYRDDKELVAVIATAIAMKMKTSVDNIVIKNIEKLDDRSPAWNRAGIIEQMNSRL
jgi:sodium pump decarboxylase gamma subunit